MEVLEKIINNPVKLWATVILAISEISALIFLSISCDLFLTENLATAGSSSLKDGGISIPSIEIPSFPLIHTGALTVYLPAPVILT